MPRRIAPSLGVLVISLVTRSAVGIGLASRASAPTAPPGGSRRKISSICGCSIGLTATRNGISRCRAVQAHPIGRRRCDACRIARRPACSDPGCCGVARTCAARTGISMAWPHLKTVRPLAAAREARSGTSRGRAGRACGPASPSPRPPSSWPPCSPGRADKGGAGAIAALGARREEVAARGPDEGNRHRRARTV